MIGKRLLRVSLYFFFWLAFFNISNTYQLLSNLHTKQFIYPIPLMTYLEMIFLILIPVNVVYFPFAGLLGTGHAYISEIIKKRNMPDGYNKNLSIGEFILPAIILSILISICSFVLTIFVIHNINHQVANKLQYYTTGEMKLTNYRSDREKGISQLLSEVTKSKTLLDVEESKEIKNSIKRHIDGLMVEVYKKFTFPLLSFICPLLGVVLSIILSGLKLGNRVIFYVIALYISNLILGPGIWCLVVIGEILGNQSLLQPIIAMLLAPIVVLLLTLTLSKRCMNIITFNHKYT